MLEGLPERLELREELDAQPGEQLWRAIDRQLEREVFVKRGRADASTAALREARMLARVQHPGVCRLFEVIETASGPLLVLEPANGETLADALERDGRWDGPRVQTLGMQIAQAAQAVHAEGIVHRGISAHSILVAGDGTAKLTGFTFAKPNERGFGLSSLDYGAAARDGAPNPGLPAHPAPEQLEGRSSDARADVFALGCVLFRSLTGEDAFARDEDVVTGTVRKSPILAKAPPPLREAIARCIKASPSKRFQTMNELAAALTPAPGQASAAPATGPRSRLPWFAAVAGAGALALGLGLWSISGTDPQTTRGLRPELDRAPRLAPGQYLPRYTGGRALLVGIDYEGSPNDLVRLANAERDVLTLAEGLRELGWKHVDVLTGSEATYAKITDTLGKLESAETDEQVFVYYAGHGKLHPNSDEQTDAGGYVLPYDAGAPRPGRTDGERWLHFDEFGRLMRTCRAKHLLIALDCCHGGAALERGAELPTAFSEEFLTRRARIKMASARPEQKALDDSAFAKTFRDALQRARTSAVTSADIWAELLAPLRNDGARRGQAPVMQRVDADGEFVFVQHRD